MTFNLCAEPWIKVRYLDGSHGVVSLAVAFSRAAEIARIAGEGPTQDVAIFRQLLAVLYRVVPSGDPAETWARWWQEGLPLQDIEDYLSRWAHRFHLIDEDAPFLQVAGLHTASGKRSGLTKMIADVPDGHAFFTQRAGSGRERLSAAEAARWLVHCQAFDPSGIKSGAVGDDRVSGGKGYPIGVGWTGHLGLVVVEGTNLAETLLLNLELTAADRAHDLPAWERPVPTAGVDLDRRPVGPADLYTWLSRRIILVWEDGEVVDVQVSNGDKLTPQNLVRLEPMTGWRRSQAQEKKLGEATVYMPLTHDPARQVWRGLASLLDPWPVGSREDAARLRPTTLEWLAHRQLDGSLEPDLLIRWRVVGITYGSQQSVIEVIVDDAIDSVVAAVIDPTIHAMVTHGITYADEAVKALAAYAGNLADATNSSGKEGARTRAYEQGYAALDPGFRRWFAALRPTSDAQEALGLWGDYVQRVIRTEGGLLIDSVSPEAFKGRTISRPGNGKSWHMDVGKASTQFETTLRKAVGLVVASTRKDGDS